MDAFVVKLKPDGSGLIYSTLLGGSSSDETTDIAVDNNGNACVSGITQSADFPVTPGAYDTQYGNRDAFVAKLDSEGGALVFSSFIGGSDRDRGRGIAIDTTGNVYVVGMTNSRDFPTTQDAYDRDQNGSYDLFVAKFNPQASSLLYSTFLGGNNWEDGLGIAVSASGCAYVTGYTYSPNFPATAGALMPAYAGEQDLFLCQLSPNGDRLAYSTYLGMSGDDYGDGLALSASGDVYLTGYTFSPDFPTTPGVYDRTHHGSSDVFVARIRIGSSVGVAERFSGGEQPDDYTLCQNYPNPFNTSSNIQYRIPMEGLVILKIFNILGQDVRTLIDKPQSAGSYVVLWDGRDDAGQELSSGVYFCRLQAGEHAQTVKMVLLR
jgi:hypothetical protein